MISEAILIERLTGKLTQGDDVLVGPGDDCAVVRAGDEDWLLTSDPVIEAVHFSSDADPRQIGHKAVARAVSDIAAMGGRPRWALINLVVPDGVAPARLESIYEGAAATAAQYAMTIAGGDVARGPALELHLFAVGSLPRDSAILRSGARPGDALFVTGKLGGSRMADHHLTFSPRLREGQWLREGDWATAMCDISDGLSTDLSHLIVASQVGAELNLHAIPCSEAARSTADPIDHALHDGEDFELLFTVPEERVNAFVIAWRTEQTLPCTRIGAIVAGRQVECIGPNGKRTVVSSGGYDHFVSRGDRP